MVNRNIGCCHVSRHNLIRIDAYSGGVRRPAMQTIARCGSRARALHALSTTSGTRAIAPFATHQSRALRQKTGGQCERWCVGAGGLGVLVGCRKEKTEENARAVTSLAKLGHGICAFGI